MRRRTARSLLAYLFFISLFGGACALAVSFPVAQDAPKPEKKPAAKPDAKPGFPEWVDTRADGPAELFTPLPAEGLFEGKAPTVFHKAVLLDVPFADSWNDDPVEDLPSVNRTAARALRYYLEQRLDYLPNVYMFLPQHDTNNYMARTRRFNARLRFTAGFAPGKAPEIGAKSEALEAAAVCFGADLVFATAYAQGEPPRALCVRYRRGKGIEAVQEVALGVPSERTLVESLPATAASVCAGLATVKAADGKTAELTVAPIPPIAGTDAALRRCVRMREALESTKLTPGWIEYEELKKLETPSGRAATWAMEIFRGLADRDSGAGQRDNYLGMCLRVAREGLARDPNDVLLRGKMCRYSTIWFKRNDWALAGIRQALRVQPANAHLLDWHVIVEYTNDRARQAEWITATAMPLLPDGRAHYLLGTCQFEAGRYADGVDAYREAIKRSPGEHEYHFSLGLCATYMAEQLDKADLPGAEGAARREKVLDTLAIACDALITAQRLDPTELGWAYEYHLRAGSRGYTMLPTNPDTLERLMLTHAVANAMEPSSRTQKWDKLVEPLIGTYRRMLRSMAREADAAGPDYQLWLMARLQFAVADKNTAEAIETLRVMRKWGHRSDLYRSSMYLYGVMVDQQKKD